MEKNLNTRQASQVDDKHIQKRLDDAHDCFNRSKQGAANAAAYLWLVFDETRTDLGTKWLKERFDEREKDIAEHNDDLLKLKERVGKHAKGLLKEADYRDEAEKAELDGLVSRTKEEWAALRKLPINPRVGANQYTALARYGLKIENQCDAPLASRYALAVQWVNEQEQRFEDPDEIVATIYAAGGFEAVVEAQRKKNAGRATPTNDDAKDRQITADVLAKDAIDAVKAAAPIATFKFQTERSRDGLTGFLARYSEGQADIVGEVPLGEHEPAAMAIRAADLKKNPGTAFVRRVLALGELVAEGKETSQTIDGTQAGERIKEKRTYCLLPSAPEAESKPKAGGARCCFLISAAHAEAGVVVQAIPASEVNLGSLDSPMIMGRNDVQQLSYALGQSGAAHLMNIQPDQTSGFAWVLENKALIEAERPNGRRSFEWHPLAPEKPKPLDVYSFRPQFMSRVTVAEIRRLYNERLSAWGESGGKKSRTLAAMAFKDKRVTFKVSGAEPLSIDCEQVAEPLELEFRARDLYLIVRVLIEQPTDSFELSGDDAGLLRIAWTDAAGEYCVYQPTAISESRLQGRCLAPLRLTKSNSRQAETSPA